VSIGHSLTLRSCHRLNQDNERNAAVMVELERVDILLIVCSAQSATGSLTMEVGMLSASPCIYRGLAEPG
jgi:hypothetical protein